MTATTNTQRIYQGGTQFHHHPPFGDNHAEPKLHDGFWLHYHDAAGMVAVGEDQGAHAGPATTTLAVTLALSGLPGSCPHCGETPPDGTWPVGTHGGLVVLCPCCYVVAAPVRAVAAPQPHYHDATGYEDRACWCPSPGTYAPQGSTGYGSGEDEADVPMVCTFCRMPVVRGGPGWVHLTALDSSRCRRLEADVTAMVAAGNGSGEDEPLTVVPMVCTACRKPVVRGQESGEWFHADSGDIHRCSRTVPVRAMVAAGNENVPADEHLEDLNTCPEAYRWEAD